MADDNSTEDDNKYTPPEPREFTFTHSIKIPRISPTTLRYAWTENTLRSFLSTSFFTIGLSLLIITLLTKTTQSYIHWSAFGLSAISVVYGLLSYWTIFENYQRVLSSLFIICLYILYQLMLNEITTLLTTLLLLTVSLFFLTYYTAKTKTIGKTIALPKNLQN